MMIVMIMTTTADVLAVGIIIKRSDVSIDLSTTPYAPIAHKYSMI